MPPGAAGSAAVWTCSGAAPRAGWASLLTAAWPPPHWFSSTSLSSQLDTGKTFQAILRFDTDVELAYFHNGGILNYMIRKMAK